MSIPDPKVFKVKPGGSFTFRKVMVSLEPDGKLRANGSVGKTHIIFPGHAGGSCSSRLTCLVVAVGDGEFHAYSGMPLGPQMLDTDAILESHDLA